MKFNVIPGPATVNKDASVTIKFNAGDGLSLDTYRMYVGIPSTLDLNSIPEAVDGEVVYDNDGKLVE